MRTVIGLGYGLVACIVVMGLYGCGMKRMYSGPRLPSDQVAILERESKWNQIVTAFDGQKPFSGNVFGLGREIEILPGKHDLVVRYDNPWTHSVSDQTVTFTVKPAARYILRSNISGDWNDRKWSPGVEEKQ